MATINLPNIIDVEASGFGRGSYPIEVGLVLSTGQRFCTLIRPDDSWQHWQESAENVHKISRRQLFKFGKDIEWVAQQLNSILGGQTIYTDAWGNDSSWIARLFDQAGMHQNFKIDSLVNLLSEQQMSIWHETKDKLAENSPDARHRASNDALLIQQTYVETLLKVDWAKQIDVA